MGACTNFIVHIISRRKLIGFYKQHVDAQGPLEAWYDHAKKNAMVDSNRCQKDYGDDLVLPDNRAVFNIKGNPYRLVVRFNYPTQCIFIRFIGTHAEYNQIDATKI
jgi:mRNA interferase HigB